MEANEYMPDAVKEKESSGKKDDDHNNPPSGGEGDGQDTKQGQFPENKGTLMLDATCAPSNIRYPQDFSLLNEAREKLETVIMRFCKTYGFSRPRMYQNKTHSVDNRIVSIAQPWIRPIVRGKTKSPVDNRFYRSTYGVCV